MIRTTRSWRSLEELADSAEFRELVAREFATPLEALPELSRRRFLQIMGASFALAGLAGCTMQPDEEIVPYVRQPEQMIPGKPVYYATATAHHGGFAQGLLVESHEGRPTKIEGNPEHPASLGSSDLFAQASVLDLYDPDRVQTPLNLGRIRGWDAFEAELAELLAAQEALGGAGIRILSGSTTSPSFARMMARVRARFPQARWHRWDGVQRDGERQASLDAFGEFVQLRHDLREADVILSLDADFLGDGPWHLPNAREFAQRRKVVEGQESMNRLYAVESLPTASGSLADHRLARKPSQVATLARAIAHELGVSGVDAVTLDAEATSFAHAVAEDLKAHRGRSVVVAGGETSAALQTLVHAMNAALGNVGRTVLHSDPVEVEPVLQGQSLRELCEVLRTGNVDLLIVLGGNPVFDTPVDLDFHAALAQAKLRVHLSADQNETSRYCQWLLPVAHELESWGDLRAVDGTLTLQQPLIRPLYQGRSAIDFLAWLADEEARGKELIRATWADLNEKTWQQWLHDGLSKDSAAAPRSRSLRAGAAAAASRTLAAASSEGFELSLRHDPSLYDGSRANNAWLQECPRPLTKLTWDNAALLSPATAQRLGVASEDEIVVRRGGREIKVAAWIQPGMAADCVGLYYGGGRRQIGAVGKDSGVDVYPLRGATGAVTVERTGRKLRLASTQLHHNMEGRDIVRFGDVADYEHDPEHFAQPHGHHVDANASLMPGFEYDGHKWGLTVDLGSCTGCNACVIACQSENNIPVVGKDEVLNGREMHWIRIDRYFAGEPENPVALNQPVMCMHCEQAPCEVVCPVGATAHSDEGLNDMVYNRCVGTRYCSNNCPYKVRRFNYYQYTDKKSETLAMQRNPDVTVRNRGVMEKCTYCVQRINQARIEAKVSDLPLGGDQITTACQQACPTQAIAFGDMNDAESQIARWKASPLNYDLLGELGVRPRTSYLARVGNPNPALAASGGHGGTAAAEPHHG